MKRVLCNTRGKLRYTHAHREVWSHPRMTHTHRGRSTAGTRPFTGRNNHFPQSNSHKQKGCVNPRHLWYFSKLPSPALPIFITSGGSTAVVRPGRHWRTNGRRRTRQPQRPDLPSPCAVPRTLPCMENTDDTLSPSFGYKTAAGKVQGSGLSRPTHSSFELTPAAAERKDGRRGKERHQHGSVATTCREGASVADVIA